MRELAWLAVEGLVSGDLDPRRASALASIGRLLVVLGTDATSERDALVEVERRARLMHGLPPANEAEWEWARERFTAEAVAEFERWERNSREKDLAAHLDYQARHQGPGVR